jgi:hypothetical protein
MTKWEQRKVQMLHMLALKTRAEVMSVWEEKIEFQVYYV